MTATIDALGISALLDWSRSSLLPRTTKLLLPYLYHLPTPLLTLPPALLLHYSTHPAPSPLTFLSDPLSHPLHLPLLFLIASIPPIYILGLITHNVSWVDRLWPIYTPICSALTCLYLVYSPHASLYAHNLPRVALLLGVQLVWSVRLLSNAIRRGVYPLPAEDYRYTAVRKLVPRWLWTFVHLVVIAIAQPILLFALSLPLTAVLLLPSSESRPGPGGWHLTLGSVLPFLPAHLRSTTAPTSTPVLTPTDALVALFGLACVFVEYKVDNAMFAFHSSKARTSASGTVPEVQPKHSNPEGYPPATAYPVSHHPGFPTTGWWAWSRHPNFAGEQLFWAAQALFVAGAAKTSEATRARWVGGDVWLPPLALSLLFCSSTTLTEWITTQKYPLYRQHKQLVGQFLPQETALVYLWGTVRGTRAKALEQVYKPPATPAPTYGSTTS